MGLFVGTNSSTRTKLHRNGFVSCSSPEVFIEDEWTIEYGPNLQILVEQGWYYYWLRVCCCHRSLDYETEREAFLLSMTWDEMRWEPDAEKLHGRLMVDLSVVLVKIRLYRYLKYLSTSWVSFRDDVPVRKKSGCLRLLGISGHLGLCAVLLLLCFSGFTLPAPTLWLVLVRGTFYVCATTLIGAIFFGRRLKFGRAHMKSVRMTRWLLAIVSPDLETKKKLIMNIKRVFGYICFYMLADVCRRVRENDSSLSYIGMVGQFRTQVLHKFFSLLYDLNLHNLTVLFFFVQAAFFRRRRALDG